MFKPKYTLTPKLLSTLSGIERLYGQVEALRIPKKLELNLNRDNLIQSSYASNRIEGNPLTLPEVTNLILADRVPTNRDEKEVANYFALLKSLKSVKNKSFSISLAKDIHKHLLNGVDESAGKIRNERVVVGRVVGPSKTIKVKHEPPFHKTKRIEKALLELFAWVNKETGAQPVVQAGIFHHQFVYIHPFEDGNGRVCRLLTALVFLKRGYEINKYFVLDDYYDIDRNKYSDSLHSADSGDKTSWLEYFTGGVKSSLEGAKTRIENAMFKLKIEERPTKAESKVLEIMKEIPEATSTEIAIRLKVSRQQAHKLLKGLTDKGYVDQKGSTKGSYYRLK